MRISKIIPLRVNATLLLMLSLYCLVMEMAEAENTNGLSSEPHDNFAVMFQNVPDGSTENVIYSPVSIRSALTLLFFGAEGETEQEMRNVLALGNDSREDIANIFEVLMQSSFNRPTNENSANLRMVNRIYVRKGDRVNSTFNAIASKSFESEAEEIDFGDSVNAVKKINSFVEDHTEHKIKDLLQNSSVDGFTRMVLVNAIYFKGQWEQPFNVNDTHKADFSYNNKRVETDMMHLEAKGVQYGEFPNLDAKVLELRYNNSNISMMFFLPNTNNGLEHLEEKLESNFHNILEKVTGELKEGKVDVHIPKFRIEFEIDLKPVLEQLGMPTAFDGRADFSSLFENDNGEYVSEVKHKAFIDVNEAGSEAAAATYVLIPERVFPGFDFEFQADHPFMFLIREESAVYFVGHVNHL